MSHVKGKENESNGQIVLTETNLLPQNNEKDDEGKCLSYTIWVFQTIVWLSIIGIIIGRIFNKKIIIIIGCIIFGITYLIYIIMEFCSPTCKYGKIIYYSSSH